MSKGADIVASFKCQLELVLAAEARCPMCAKAKRRHDVEAVLPDLNPAADDQSGSTLPIICFAHSKIRGRIALEGMRTWRQGG